MVVQDEDGYISVEYGVRISSGLFGPDQLRCDVKSPLKCVGVCPPSLCRCLPVSVICRCPIEMILAHLNMSCSLFSRMASGVLLCSPVFTAPSTRIPSLGSCFVIGA